jgi:hypothetical protein
MLVIIEMSFWENIDKVLTNPQFNETVLKQLFNEPLLKISKNEVLLTVQIFYETSNSYLNYYFFKEYLAKANLTFIKIVDINKELKSLEVPWIKTFVQINHSEDLNKNQPICFSASKHLIRPLPVLNNMIKSHFGKKSINIQN